MTVEKSRMLAMPGLSQEDNGEKNQDSGQTNIPNQTDSAVTNCLSNQESETDEVWNIWASLTWPTASFCA